MTAQYAADEAMTLPTTMRAVEITQPGKPEVLKIGTRPVPQPRPGEVLIRVAAAGVNRPDVLRSEEHTSELQSLAYLVCRLLLEKKKEKIANTRFMLTT